jgi:hypothetical protein
MLRLLSAIALLAISPATFGAFDATSSRATTLEGRWKINPALSDDAEKLLAERLEKEYAEERRWRERTQAMRPPGPDTSLQMPPPSEERRRRRNDLYRQMLGVTEHLTIAQSDNGAKVEIGSDAGSRRFVAGTHSQVSLPEGELADSEVGWDGDWFVIDRRAKRGPRVVEKYRFLPKTGQLETSIAWGGDTFLSGMKVRRIFDRDTAEVKPPDPGSGPVR